MAQYNISEPPVFIDFKTIKYLNTNISTAPYPIPTLFSSLE